jgi:hypothetical protein
MGVTDVFVWGLHQNGQFSVKSMYNALNADTRVMFSKMLWNLKIPLRIKIFMWYFERGIVLKKDNLARYNWEGNMLCAFCAQHEMIQLLFLIVILLDSYGGQCMQSLILESRRLCHIFLMNGLMFWGTVLKTFF